MKHIWRCVTIQGTGSVAYLYPKELHQADMPNLSIAVLSSSFEKLLPDKTAARDSNCNPGTQLKSVSNQPQHPKPYKNRNQSQSSRNGSLGQVMAISTDSFQEKCHSGPDHDEYMWDFVASASIFVLKLSQGPSLWAAFIYVRKSSSLQFVARSLPELWPTFCTH